MLIKKLALSVGLFTLFLSTYTQAALDPSMTFKNRRGSLLVLTWHADLLNTGTLNGTFTTAVGNCKQDVGIPLPLLGFFNGNAISITVNFPHCKQVIAMTGNVTHDQTKIHMLWLDTNQAEHPLKRNWNSNVIGSDLYERVS